MTEPGPVTFSLLAAAVAVLGPVLGPYALIVFAAGVGAGLALSAEKPLTRWEGAKFLAVSTVVALVLTSPIVWAVQNYTSVPANVALIPVAFVLGACRAQLLSVIRKALDLVPAVVEGALKVAGYSRGGGQ